MKIFIHIGLPKAGSKSIQDCLWHNRELLLSHGYWYTRESARDKSHTHLARAVINKEGQKVPLVIKGAWKRLLKKLDSCQQENVVISSEAFVNINDKGIVKLRNILKAYDVKLIIYLRRSDNQIISAYAQNMRAVKHTGDFKSFFQTVIDDNGETMSTRRFYFDKLLKPWVECWGKDKMAIRILESEQLYGKQLLTDFLNCLDIPEKVFSEFKTDMYSNEGISSKGLRFMHAVLQPLEEDLQQELGPNLFNLSRNELTGDKFEIGLEERTKIVKHFSENNAVVARDYLDRADGILFREPIQEKTVVNSDFGLSDVGQEEIIRIYTQLLKRLKVDSKPRKKSKVMKSLKLKP